jgi:GTPase
MSKPIVAIIGRPNVGKSTLFNRLIKKRHAVVDDEPGVTRDRNYHLANWSGKSFYLVDTGGLVPSTKNEIEKLVKAQAEIAIDEADLVLFLIDTKVGAQEIDLEITDKLRKRGKNLILVANKVDSEKDELEIHVLNRLGLGEPFSISAQNGRNIGDLLDRIIDFLPEKIEEEKEEESIKVAVVGRTNVGKSSFVNALLGENKLIVSSQPGTTRDSIDTQFKTEDRLFTLIDTAGLKKKSKVKDGIEYYTSLRTLRSIERCDVALLLVEAQIGLLKQDIKIAQEIADQWKGIVLVVNKWDLVEKDSKTADIYTKQIREVAPFIDYVPIIYVSALTGQRVYPVLKLVGDVQVQMRKRIETSQLNKMIGEEIKRRPPAAVGGKYIKIYYLTQTDIHPPTFVFFCNYPELLEKAYLKFLTNQIRVHFGFAGCPLRIKVRKRE